MSRKSPFAYISCLILLLRNGVIVSCDGTDSNPTAMTTCGPVQGIQNSSAYSFRGIPYGVPPVDSLRWQPPVPLTKKSSTCWNGTFVANKFGNTCFQPDPANMSQYIGNEDCLYLNIWTPTLDVTAGLDVMVWIHGGSLIVGNGNFPSYSPYEKLANLTNIVYVSMNYRLNAFGFMALDIISEASATKTSGNYGLMDQILAMQWVRENIVNFGGDKNKVTVFGQSSGGTSIFALLASPLASGLFQKAWLMSSSPLLNKNTSEASKDNMVFVNNTGCSDLQCLLDLPAIAICKAVPWNVYPYWAMEDLYSLPVKMHFDGALPVVDAYVLPRAPFDVWLSGNANDVPLMIGSTAQENDIGPPQDIRTWDWSRYNEYVEQKLGTFSSTLANGAMKFYPHHITPEYQLTSLSSDIRTICPNEILTMIAARSFKSEVYRYIATAWPSRPAKPFGFLSFPAMYSFHAWDSVAFFNTINYFISPEAVSDLDFTQNVQHEILSFVRSGKPASANWKPYKMTTALLAQNTSIVHAYKPQECQYWFYNNMFPYAWIN